MIPGAGASGPFKSRAASNSIGLCKLDPSDVALRPFILIPTTEPLWRFKSSSLVNVLGLLLTGNLGPLPSEKDFGLLLSITLGTLASEEISRHLSSSSLLGGLPLLFNGVLTVSPSDFPVSYTIKNNLHAQ